MKYYVTSEDYFNNKFISDTNKHWIKGFKDFSSYDNDYSIYFDNKSIIYTKSDKSQKKQEPIKQKINKYRTKLPHIKK